MLLEKNTKLLFIGDSITDVDRARPVGEDFFEGLGRGYVSQINALLTSVYPDYNIRVVNMGTSGNTTRELCARWQTDVIDQAPDWLSIMIGTNDVWRQFDYRLSPEKCVPLDEYRSNLEKLIEQTSVKKLVLMTPFYMEPLKEDAMRKTMDAYGQVVKELAQKYGAILVDTQTAFDKLFEHMYSSAIAWDRVHPNTVGSMVLAKAFLDAIGFEWSR